MESECLSIDEHPSSSSSDRISTLPEPILEIILCLLPTKDAARTSILSWEWRYKWNQIPTLEFYTSYVSKRTREYFSKLSYQEKQVQKENIDATCKPFYKLFQILLLHQGLIHEFILREDTIEEDHPCGLQYSFGLDQLVRHLAKNHPVKILELNGMDAYDFHCLPEYVFSMQYLTDLHLSCFCICGALVFSGFSSLLSLSLVDLVISTKSLLHILSNCPSLKRLRLILFPTYLGDRDCTIIKLFKCLPKIEYFSTSEKVPKWLVLDSVPQELPALLSHLKYFHFINKYRVDGDELSFLPILIKCSPNLKKIKLQILWDYYVIKEYYVIWKKYSDVWLKNLNELEIECFHYSDERKTNKEFVKLVKFFLARSPKLKKVVIFTLHVKDPGSELLKTLERSPRRSPEAVITIASRGIYHST